MKSKLEGYKKRYFLAIVFIALGVSFSTTMGDEMGGVGTVFIAIGGLFLISAMSLHRKVDKVNKK